MEYGIIDFLKLMGALGLFIYGMKIMSEGLQKAAGDKLRKVLKGMTSTRLSGVLTGFLTTSIVQSSSATTVMVVSFVNAGMLTLSESMGVIMGANIGTTVTAWIISLLGFKVKITAIAIIMIGVTFPFMFAKKDSLKHFAEFIMGFGILFIGLEFLKEAVPDIKGNPQILEFLAPLTGNGFFSVLLFILIGTVLTIIVQSSSASMALTLVMLAEGWIDFPTSAAIVLGENIGTTITANLAAMVGNVHAKRAARFHFLFNVIGVLWMLAVFNYFLQGIDYIQSSISSDHLSVFDPTSSGRENATLALSLFHSTFNILNVALLIGFVPLLEKLVIWVQPSKGQLDEEIRLTYISSGLMSTPELSLAEAKKELQFFGKTIDKMCNSLNALLFEKPQNPEAIIEKIKKREQMTDDIEIDLANFLTKVSESDISHDATRKVGSMLSMANDLERIGDIFYQMTKNHERTVELKANFPADARTELKELFELMTQAIKAMRANMEKEPEEVDMKKVFEIEGEINHKRKEMTKHHHGRLENNSYTAQEGVIFLDFVNRCERIGDHLVNVNEAMAGLK